MAKFLVWMTRRARWFLLLCAFGLSLPWWGRLLLPGHWGWLLDLAVHWQWLYAFGVAASAGLLTLRCRHWAWCLPLALLPLLSASPALEKGVAEGVPLRLASANLYADNIAPGRMQTWLESHPVDLLLLLEITPQHLALLETLEDYPWRVLEPAEGPFGIALLSRLPLEEAQVMRDGPTPYIEAKIRHEGRELRVLGLHPMPPVSVGDLQARDALFASVARRSDMPLLVMGDFNATPWSVAFRHMGFAGLKRASRLLPTWPAVMPAFPGIPIDHVLASAHFVPLQQGRGPFIGSDHYPVVSTLAWRAAD